MPKILGGVPATTSASTSATISSLTPQQWTLAAHGHTTQSVVVNLYGSFSIGFDPQWLITTVTACAGGTTGSSRYVAGTDFFPHKRATAAQSASSTSACAFELYLENREK